jgi:putative transposase
MQPSMLRKRPRLNPALYVGLQRYFLTFCTSDRREWFTERDGVDLVHDQILRCAADFDVAVIAYCYMPDHLHLLVEACSERSDATRFVHQAKQRSGHAFSKQYGKRLWQPSYYDHVLRDDEASISVTRYIFENPVVAGLAVSPSEYPFLGSDRFTIEGVLEAVQWKPRRQP